jgi:translation initiation factor IF-2
VPNWGGGAPYGCGGAPHCGAGGGVDAFHAAGPGGGGGGAYAGGGAYGLGDAAAGDGAGGGVLARGSLEG